MNNYYIKEKPKRRPREFILGKYYKIRPASYSYYIITQLIRPTQKGFNFLNIKTHKCVLKNHLYKSKCENHRDGLWLWINENYIIEEYNECIGKELHCKYSQGT